MAGSGVQINRVTCFLIVLLRVAIGWHLCYEGLSKIASLGGNRPFTAEYYLRASTGPLADRFADLVDDRYGFDALDEQKQTAKWDAVVASAAELYAYDADQLAKMREKLKELTDKLSTYLRDAGTQKKIREYEARLVRVREHSSQPMSTFERAEWQKEQAEVEASRRSLVGPVQEWTSELKRTLQTTATPNQLAAVRPWDAAKQWTHLEWIDATTMYGLAGFGALLIVGLFTRTAALGAACLLALFYLSMPPLPGLPPPPNAEGNYLIVNKNLIELLACLMLATTQSGVWGGLDALIRGLVTRPLFGIGRPSN